MCLAALEKGILNRLIIASCLLVFGLAAALGVGVTKFIAIIATNWGTLCCAA
jgi:hypothetical protein